MRGHLPAPGGPLGPSSLPRLPLISHSPLSQSHSVLLTLLTMEAAQKLVKQRSMEALDKLRTYTNVEENSRRGSTYNLGSGAGAKEASSHI